ncbi:hypothetical protein [Actinomadura geliboluensis]|uniref:hypothetical protein n=1 Tax=Actinomadura geliboluensis TaxID=882440 RepID=UPI00262AD853|nr:hypothetical protein [Actinomadura geliboluensis]
MTALIALMFVLAACCLLLACVDQRKLYWKTGAWQYRNPEANEPSESAFAMRRASLVIGAVVFVVMGFVFKAADSSLDYSTAQVRSVAYAAASELDRGSGTGLGSSYRAGSDVFDAVQEEGNGNVRVRRAGSGKYELTNRKGKNPVCLTVTVDNKLRLGGSDPWSHSISTSVDEGTC